MKSSVDSGIGVIETKEAKLEIDYGSFIGQGAFGSVYKCTYSQLGVDGFSIDAVVKIQNKKTSSDNDVENGPNESKINKMLNYELATLAKGEKEFIVMRNLGRHLPTYISTTKPFNAHFVEEKSDLFAAAEKSFAKKEQQSQESQSIEHEEVASDREIEVEDKKYNLDKEQEVRAEKSFEIEEIESDTTEVEVEADREKEEEKESYFEMEVEESIPDGKAEVAVDREKEERKESYFEEEKIESSEKDYAIREDIFSIVKFPATHHEEKETEILASKNVSFQNIPEIIMLFQKINLAVMELHQHGIVHLDLKPANILYDVKNEKINIIDFGFSQMLNENVKQKLIGTPVFLPPELAKDPLNGFFSVEQDIYSLGKTFLMLIKNYLEAMSDKVIFVGPPDNAQYGLLGNIYLSGALNLHNIQFENPSDDINIHAINELIKIIRDMLKVDPENRMSLQKVNEKLLNLKERIEAKARSDQGGVSPLTEIIPLIEHLKEIKLSLDSPHPWLKETGRKKYTPYQQLSSSKSNDLIDSVIEKFLSIAQNASFSKKEKLDRINQELDSFISSIKSLPNQNESIKKLEEARQMYQDSISSHLVSKPPKRNTF